MRNINLNSEAPAVLHAVGIESLVGDIRSARGASPELWGAFARAERLVQSLLNKVAWIPAGDVVAREEGVETVWHVDDRNLGILFSRSTDRSDYICCAKNGTRQIGGGEAVPLEMSILVNRFAWLGYGHSVAS